MRCAKYVGDFMLFYGEIPRMILLDLFPYFNFFKKINKNY
jgi:hypothetical protein